MCDTLTGSVTECIE